MDSTNHITTWRKKPEAVNLTPGNEALHMLGKRKNLKWKAGIKKEPPGRQSRKATFYPGLKNPDLNGVGFFNTVLQGKVFPATLSPGCHTSHSGESTSTQCLWRHQRPPIPPIQKCMESVSPVSTGRGGYPRLACLVLLTFPWIPPAPLQLGLKHHSH